MSTKYKRYLKNSDVPMPRTTDWRQRKLQSSAKAGIPTTPCSSFVDSDAIYKGYNNSDEEVSTDSFQCQQWHDTEIFTSVSAPYTIIAICIANIGVLFLTVFFRPQVKKSRKAQ